MGRPKKEDSEKEDGGKSSQDILGDLLNKNQKDHYNDIEEAEDLKISTGSLILDSQMGGGFSAGGLLRFVGYTEGGKTSESLQTMKNYLESVPNSKGFYIKAEGRLSKEMQDRTGIKFVWDKNNWVTGTCFVLETNIYDLVVEIMRQLVMDNQENNKYCFVLDSMDGLILRSDMAKNIEDAGKVAGAPMLTKKFMQRLAISMNKLGHMCIMIGQVSAKVDLNPYGPSEIRQISATGGNAALHFANWILQFEPRYGGDNILENDKEKPDPFKNKILGHWCKVIIKKSPNEKSNMLLKYPIKYGRKDGNSIWREYEVIDVLTMYSLITRKAAWISFDENLIAEALESGITIQTQLQGQAKMLDYLETNKDVTDWLIKKLKSVMLSE